MDLAHTKKGGKKGAKKKSGVKTAAVDQLEMQEKYQLPFVSVSGVEWVTLHIKLFTWDYMNFSEIVSLDTPLFHIQDKIMQRHGRSVTGLVIYKDSVRPQNALQDHRATLKELQVPGAVPIPNMPQHGELR